MASTIGFLFFDATETLFHVRGSVGQIYAEVAEKRGIALDPNVVNQRFGKVMKAAPPLCFPDLKESEIQSAEEAWWKARVREILPTSFSESLFADLYTAFLHPHAWEVFAEVLPTLKELQAKGMALGIISNFDSRLSRILAGLGLRSFFRSIICSAEAGFAKPDQRIFNHALPKTLHPHQVGYVGNDLHKDIEPALALGMRAFLINRQAADQEISLGTHSYHVISNLQHLLKHI